MIIINQDLYIPEEDIREQFVRSSGPGGQHVNKVATTVQLRFDVAANRSLPDPVKKRLQRMAGRALNRDGVLVIIAGTSRSRERNRGEARERLIALIRRAAQTPKPHKQTRIPLHSRLQRLESKKKRGTLKSTRHRISITGS